MISMVALTPIITLQILGFIFKIKSKKEVFKKMVNNPEVDELELLCVIVNYGMASK